MKTFLIEQVKKHLKSLIQVLGVRKKIILLSSHTIRKHMNIFNRKVQILSLYSQKNNLFKLKLRLPLKIL